MSPRWRYQLKWGTLWGVVMAVGIMAFTAWGADDWTLFWSRSFFIRLVVFLVVGIFLVAWLNWRDLQKRKK